MKWKTNNNMKNLIMITNYFPYGNDTGEMYLQNEIFKLSEKFNKIIIFSCDACKEDKLFTNILPKNVIPIPLAKYNKKSKLKYIFKTFFTMIKRKNKEVKDEWKEKKGFFKHIFLSYFITKSQDRLDKINSLDIFEKYIITDSIIIYSYRLFDLAYIGLKIKSKLVNELNFKNVKAVSRAHGYDLYEDRNKLNYLPLRKYLFNNLDKVYLCSKYGEDYLNEKYKKYSEKFICSYLGSKDYKYDYLPIQNKTLEIISCSNVIPVKRVQMISEVVRKLSKKINVHWTHIGGGKDFEKLKSSCNDLINDNIAKIMGAISHKDVLEFYQKNHFDLFINLSLSEGLPQSIMEAISFGIPTIATDAGGTSEIVIDNVSGILIPLNENVDTIVEKILLFQKKSNDEIIEFRKTSRDFWKNNFDSDNNSDEFIRELERL